MKTLLLLIGCLVIYLVGKRMLEKQAVASGEPWSKRDRRIAAKLGLQPLAHIDAKAPAPADAAFTAARKAVRAGDWAAGAAFVEGAGRDWSKRADRITWLADQAVKDDTWLQAWREARPNDPTAAAVHAEALVHLAWEIRGDRLASQTSREQFATFHRVLDEAREACTRAQDLAGDDPAPFINELPVAMGLGYPHARVEALWAEIEKRDPYHLGAHTAALQYWCEKWCGSNELMHDFARRAAEKGVPGQLLTTLPLHAFFEAMPQGRFKDPQRYYKRREVLAAADAALADVTAAAAVLDPHDPRIREARHMLAWTLYWQSRYTEALEQFREVDGYAGCVPWLYMERPAESYASTRDYVAARARRRGGRG